MRVILSIIFCLLMGAPASALGDVLVMDGRVTVDLPDGFAEMSAEMVAVKYPRGNAPDYVFTDASTRINLSFGSRQRPPAATPATLATSMAEILPRVVPIARWTGHGVREIDGQAVAFLHFETPAAESSAYNIENYQVIWLVGPTEMIMMNFSCTTNLESCDTYRGRLIDGLRFSAP